MILNYSEIQKLYPNSVIRTLEYKEEPVLSEDMHIFTNVCIKLRIEPANYTPKIDPTPNPDGNG